MVASLFICWCRTSKHVGIVCGLRTEAEWLEHKDFFVASAKKGRMRSGQDVTGWGIVDASISASMRLGSNDIELEH